LTIDFGLDAFANEILTLTNPERVDDPLRLKRELAAGGLSHDPALHVGEALHVQEQRLHQSSAFGYRQDNQRLREAFLEVRLRAARGRRTPRHVSDRRRAVPVTGATQAYADF